MDRQQRERSPQQEPSDVKVNPNLVIKIVMKKMDAGAGSWDHDTNNNDGVVKVKKESAAKEFCKNLFNLSSSSSGDRNNNSQQTVPVTNQYTKVTVDGLMSQLTLHQNRLQTNVSAVNHNSDANKRWVECILRVRDNETANSATWRHITCASDYRPAAEIFHELMKRSHKHIFFSFALLFAFLKKNIFPRKNKRHPRARPSHFVCRFSGNLRRALRFHFTSITKCDNFKSKKKKVWKWNSANEFIAWFWEFAESWLTTRNFPLIFDVFHVNWSKAKSNSSREMRNKKFKATSRKFRRCTLTWKVSDTPTKTSVQCNSFISFHLNLFVYLLTEIIHKQVVARRWQCISTTRSHHVFHWLYGERKIKACGCVWKAGGTF